ncbi:MAG: hypothetical protein ACTSUO_06795 [Candidatus Thorarchaeota archaeon]
MTSSDYIIRVKSDKLSFPMKCPVCGEYADAEGTIPAMSARERQVGQSITRHTSHAAGGYYAIVRSTPDFKTTTPYRIPTCARHAISYEDMGRIRTPCGIFNALFIVLLIFQAFFILGSFYVWGGPQLNDFLLLALTIIGLIITNRLSGPTVLEKAVKVIDNSGNFGGLILQIRNSEYAEELLQLNSSTAERVTPILRSESD